MKNWKGDTVKPCYEVALKQHVKGNAVDDYDQLALLELTVTGKLVRLLKHSLRTLASTATIDFTKQNSWTQVLRWCLSAATLLTTFRTTTKFGKRIMSTAKRLADIPFNKETRRGVKPRHKTKRI